MSASLSLSMSSARTQCPECAHPDALALDDILVSSTHDYFRCKDCGTWWIIQKGSDGPATVIGRSRPEQDKP
jgi:transposase-like protein